METRIVDATIVEIIGEYGIVKVKEETVWDNGKVFCRTTLYDICLEHGNGDIVTTCRTKNEARKWAKEN